MLATSFVIGEASLDHIPAFHVLSMLRICFCLAHVVDKATPGMASFTSIAISKAATRPANADCDDMVCGLAGPKTLLAAAGKEQQALSRPYSTCENRGDRLLMGTDTGFKCCAPPIFYAEKGF